MRTLSNLGKQAPVHHFTALFADARRQLLHGPGQVHELRMELEGPPLAARSRLLTSGELTFVSGENEAKEDLVLRHESPRPLVVVHVPLRGAAAPYIDGLGCTISGHIGQIQLLASPTSDTTVRLKATEINQVFRVALSAKLVLDLAERHPELEPLARSVSSCLAFQGSPKRPWPLHRLLAETTDIMQSHHYGSLRPLFLESRALSWLAIALSETPAIPHRTLKRQEVERMHAARELLLSRLMCPPTLTELARLVGTNDFALKRNFKAVFGEPVHAHLLNLRLARAEQLLKETDHSMKQVAAAVGYMHPQHFGTAFRRAYGVSPGRYRKRLRG